MLNGTTVQPNVGSTPLINNSAFYADYSAPMDAFGGMMETSSNGTVRGLGATMRSIGAPLTNEIAKGLFNGQSFGQAASGGLKNLFSGTTGAGFGMGATGTIMSAVAGPKREYSGYKGGTTKALDSAYDAISTGLSFIPGGQIFSGAMQLGKGVGSLLNNWGSGTDAMTDVDAVLGSSFFNLTPFGLYNGFGGKKSHTMRNNDFMNQSRLDDVWSGYSGTLENDLYAQTKANKKYGKFSSGARRRANRIIDAANINREELLDMQRGTELGSIRGNNMADFNAIQYDQDLRGGVKARVFGKKGLKFPDIQKTIANLPKAKQGIKMLTLDWTPSQEIQQFKSGGSMNVIPEGSLHARLHHMEDADGLTKKGIPVVDNQGNQQAEIELNEIIFRKEVTNKLEELAKDGSTEAAIEAGKLLVTEIFENTDDRTGLIEEVTGKTEMFQWGGLLGGQKYDVTSIPGVEGLSSSTTQSVQNNINEYNINKANKIQGTTQVLNSLVEGFSQAMNASKQAKTNRDQQLKAKQAIKLQNSSAIEFTKGLMDYLYGAKEAFDNQNRAELYQQLHPTLQEGGILSYEDFLNNKRQEIIYNAIMKANTRELPYTKVSPNCIATATDNFGGPVAISNIEFAQNPGKYGFKEVPYDTFDNLPDGALIQDHNIEGNPNVPGHMVMLVGRTEDGTPLYSWSSGKTDSRSMHGANPHYPFVKPGKAFVFIGTPEQNAQWQQEYEFKHPRKEQKGGTLNFKNYEELIDYMKQTGRKIDDDYDLEAAFNDPEVYQAWLEEEQANPGNGHWLDKYKKPNHMTYSIESILGEDPINNGGIWTISGNNDIFITSPYLENLYSLQEYLKYFAKNEPNAYLQYKGQVYSPGRRKK